MRRDRQTASASDEAPPDGMPRAAVADGPAPEAAREDVQMQDRARGSDE